MFVGIGFDAIAIALLARANPFGIILTSILWGSMLVGRAAHAAGDRLSIDSVRIIQALVVLFVAADVIVRTLFRITQPRDEHAVGHHPRQRRPGRSPT